MPRFFFHIFTNELSADTEGVDLPNLETAIYEASRSARAIASENVLAGRLRLSDRVVVADESTVIVASVTFRDAIDVEA